MLIQNQKYPLRYQNHPCSFQRTLNFTGFSPMKFDDLFDEYSPNLRISEREIAKYFSGRVNIIKDFLNLEGYSFDLLTTLKDKKKTELKYLYDIASKRDLTDAIRIPANRISDFASFSYEKLKSLEPIILSKNDLHLWNYEPSYILKLAELDDKRLNIFLDLAKCNVTPHSTQAILADTEINWEKVVDTAKSLKNLYGKDLREIEFYSNSKGQNLFSADIQLPHSSDKPDWLNFKRITVRLDDDQCPIGRQKLNTHITSSVDKIYNKIVDKFHLFSKTDLDNTINQVLSKCPEATEEEVLVVINKLTQFSSYKSITPMSKQLKDMGITEFANLGELYKPFNYFVNRKHLFSLCQSEEKKIGILITKNDIYNEDLMQRLNKCKGNPAFNNILFINLEGFADGVNLFKDNYKLADLTVKTLKEAKLVQNKNKSFTFDECVSHVLNNSIEVPLKKLGFNVQTIKFDNASTKESILEQMQPIMPTKDAIQSTIEMIADKYSINKRTYNKTSEFLAKYYQENVNIYSKQRIIDDLKKINKKVQEYLTENNLSKDNLYLIENMSVTEPKSYDIINRMYKKLFDVAENRILKVSDMVQINRYPEHSTFLVLDDIVGSGKSLLEIGNYDKQAKLLSPKQHIIFAPISTTESGMKYIQDNIDFYFRANNDKLIYLEDNLAKNLYHTNIFDKWLVKLFSSKFYQIMEKGFDDHALCTSFPYMAPDTNSYVSSNLVKLFLPTQDCIKSFPDVFNEIDENSRYYNLFGQKKDNLKLSSNNDEAPSWIKKLKDFILKS